MQITTSVGSVLSQDSDGSLRGSAVRELVVRPDGALVIDGELEVHSSASGLELVSRRIAPVPTQSDRHSSGITSDDSDAEPVLKPQVDKVYSSAEVAKFFGKSTQWLYWGMRTKDPKGNPVEPVFVYEDGTPIVSTHQVGKGKRRRFELPAIEEMAYACYRRGNLKENDLKKVLDKIAAARADQLT